MKKSELVKLLEKVPDDMEIGIFDYRKNVRYDFGHGSKVGLYFDFKVEYVDPGDAFDKFFPWVALSFANEEFDDSGDPVDEEENDKDIETIRYRTCRKCGCTDDDCHQCIEKTGHPCHWVAPDLCSACQNEGNYGQ